jgi:multiple sugar transport system permease protein
MATQTTTSTPAPLASQPATKYKSKTSTRAVIEMVAIYVVMIAFCLFILIPFLWPFVSAFTNKPANVSSLYLYWPKEFTWQHFYDAIVGRGQAMTLLRNSAVVAVATVVFSLVVCAMGGYALSRGRFRGKRNLMFAILLVQIIPGTATVLPFYLIMRQMGLVNSLMGVILGATAGQLPFMLWVMKGFMDTVPLELEEAAWLDGASQFQTLAQIVFPLSLPGVGAAAILAFNGVWGMFFLPLIMLSDGDKFTMPLGLFRAVVAYTNLDYGMLNAMSLLYMVPGFLIFLFARQYLIRGTMAGAMAGQ